MFLAVESKEKLSKASFGHPKLLQDVPLEDLGHPELNGAFLALESKCWMYLENDKKKTFFKAIVDGETTE
jgi:hypothetical protein